MEFKQYDELVVELRRELHKIPEIATEEFKTSEFISDKLTEWGYSIKKMYGTGVVAVIGDETKPCIAFRADIDGLPIKEENDVAYKSVNEGKMHACGHDGHIAVVLTLAKILRDNEKKIKNCIKLIFQPAEEGSGGAMPMIEEGVLENPKVEKIFGFHFWPSVEAGKIEYSSGASFAEAERYEIHIKGNGGHGAMPDGIKNCLQCGAEIINGIKNIHDSFDKTIVSACSFNSTGFHNIFADSAVIKGTIRTVIDGKIKEVETEIEKVCQNAEKNSGCFVNPVFVYEYPCLLNDSRTLGEIVKVSKEVLGEQSVYEAEGTYAAEDFSFFTKRCAAAHIKIGSYNPEKPETGYPLHNPKFNIDEDALKTAIRIFTKLAL